MYGVSGLDEEQVDSSPSWMKCASEMTPCYMQLNTFDCGVHTVKNAMDIIRHKRCTMSQDAKSLRYRYTARVQALYPDKFIHGLKVDDTVSEYTPAARTQPEAANV